MHLNGTVNPALVSRLRSDLRTARFAVDTLEALWGEQAASALFRGQRVPALRELARRESIGREAGRMPDAAASLALLFMFGMPQPRGEVAAALPALGVDGGIELGLVEIEGGQVRALIDLRPYDFTDTGGSGHWWIASDLGEVSSDCMPRSAITPRVSASTSPPAWPHTTGSRRSTTNRSDSPC